MPPKRAVILLLALIPLPGLAEAPASAPPPDPRPAEVVTEAPLRPAEKPPTALLPSDLAARPVARPAQPEPPAPPGPPAPTGKPSQPPTADTLDWERQVRDALKTDVAIAPPTPLSPPEIASAGEIAPVSAPKPRSRPDGLTWSGSAALVCKDIRLAGEAVAPIVDAGSCGVPKPIRLSAASGVALTSPVYVGCPAARALADWLATTAASAPDLLNAKVTSITPFASYSCRNRNGRAGGRLSEHAKGRAIDVGRFGLSDGRSVTIKEGWRDPKTSGFLKRAWRNACGGFGTVLGPGSDAHHQDHFHLDVAKHRSGAYCR